MKEFSNEDNIKKVKSLIKELEEVKGNGTNLITLIIDKNSKLFQVQSMLTKELKTSSNIKNNCNKKCVQTTIKSIQERLKQYECFP